jgi:CubicO group peptidase (beta-lactamase class C family)
MQTTTSILFIPVFLFNFFLYSNFSFVQEKKNDNQSSQNTRIDLDNYFKQIMETQNHVGLGVCLIKGDKIIWDGYYGYSDLEEKKKLNRENIFQLASLSKTVTATVLMQLYEKGLFKLDDDINQYIPIKVRNPNFPDKPITFRMLLTHTAGFADVTSTGNKLSLGVPGDSDIPLGEYVEELFIPGGKYYSTDYFSKNEPGKKYEYSNISFHLIGYLVEKLAKKDFAELCNQTIFQPLEMNNTGWHLRDLNTTKIVFGYGFPTSDNILSYKKVQHFGIPGYPEGMLRTTIPDFSHFISAFINQGRYKKYQVLKPETVNLMLTPQGIKNIPSRSFRIIDIGLTWLIFEVEGEQLYSMNGFSGSIFTNAFFSQKERTGIIYYCTGLSMKNMLGTTEISKKLYQALKTINW